MRILLTGVAGFIGFHTAKCLLGRGDEVIGVDNLSDYYDVNLKKARLAIIESHKNFCFLRADICDYNAIKNVFTQNQFDVVIHLAAQAGVRYSIENPNLYVQSNLVGFLNILECCRYSTISRLVYASSSSVYGANTRLPFSVGDSTDHPISFYGATKKANEVMAHSYSYLYKIPTTGLRFFTVYGPWGRPDMALFKFTKAILEGREIDVYNNGKMQRDFTYIDDVTKCVLGILDKTPFESYKIYNIGNNNPVELMDFIRSLENVLGRKAELNFLPMQDGDVPATFANVDDLKHDIHFTPSTRVANGVENFVKWYREYYKV